uniref:Protein BIG GRAIN 1 n=1 Tax=Oryza meridionalis TaxID=40149 RepID=A0A0E0CW04_9ORYZ
MERWAAPKVTAGSARRYVADQPSFSSTLLDAIYKSMDEQPGHGGGATGVEAVAAAAKKQHEAALHYGYYYKPSLAGSYRARAPGPHATTSSSSECSSYGGFSSSEAESSHHRRLRPIRTTVPGGAPAPAPEKKAKKPGASIRAKLRDLRKPASPGARLAGFLNSIFAGKRAPATPPSATAGAESACSTASSYSRSCLSKTPSTRGQAKRTVRFLDSDTESLASSTVVDRRRVPVEAVQQMLLQRMEMESDEDDDDDDESSDASSDLFELENFAAIAPAGAAYRDELPVYETTRVALNRAIGHGYGHGRSARVV